MERKGGGVLCSITLTMSSRPRVSVGNYKERGLEIDEGNKQGAQATGAGRGVCLSVAGRARPSAPTQPQRRRASAALASSAGAAPAFGTHLWRRDVDEGAVPPKDGPAVLRYLQIRRLPLEQVSLCSTIDGRGGKWVRECKGRGMRWDGMGESRWEVGGDLREEGWPGEGRWEVAGGRRGEGGRRTGWKGR